MTALELAGWHLVRIVLGASGIVTAAVFVLIALTDRRMRRRG